MATYTATYAHSANALAGRLNLDAANDKAAAAEVREFVTAGYRNSTWASAELSDGRTYTAHNRHGKAIGGYSDAVRGRPSEGKSERIEWRTTPERKAKTQRLANAAGQSVSQWLDGRIDAARG